MLVICNGAARSGSNWIYNIADQAIASAPLPDGWQRPGWSQRSFEPARLRAFLQTHADQTTVIKMHLKPTETERDELLARGDVVVLNIGRDIRGAVNAHYHWRVGRGSIEPDVDAWWEAEGRAFAQRLRAYHTLWNVEHPAYHRFYFEELLLHFPSEMERARPIIERAGGVFSSGELAERTSLGALLQSGAAGSRDLRQGQAEDWRLHLSPAVATEAVDIAGPYAFLATGV